jgi:hypothetical protein
LLLPLDTEVAEVDGREPDALLLDCEQRLGARLRQGEAVDGVDIAHLVSTPLSVTGSFARGSASISPGLDMLGIEKDLDIENPLDCVQSNGLVLAFESLQNSDDSTDLTDIFDGCREAEAAGVPISRSGLPPGSEECDIAASPVDDLRQGTDNLRERRPALS